jgi:antitoxin FitA
LACYHGAIVATVIIRNLPEDLVGRIKATAAGGKRSMEEELRQTLQVIYRDRAALIRAVRASNARQKRPVTAAEIDAWKRIGRP